MQGKFALIAIGVATAPLLNGCALVDGTCLFDCGKTRAGSTPLVAYLYPDGNVPRTDSVPVLKVPLTVGLTFLPDRDSATAIGPGEKDAILTRLRDRFRSLDYVRDIVIVPDSYLGARPGFDSLEQVAALQNLDVIALVSYDQLATSEENKRSLAYLTIVGAYFVHGTHSETSTLLDLAVVEPQSRSLLLRAGGTSQSSGSSSVVDLSGKLRRQSQRGLAAATDELVRQLDHELTLFSERVRTGNGPVRVVKRDEGGGPGFGGGRLTLAWLLLLAGVVPLSRACRCGSTHP
jgi:rhombotail lipoprotein